MNAAAHIGPFPANAIPAYTGSGPVDVYDRATGALYIGVDVQACKTAEDVVGRVQSVGQRPEKIPVFAGRRLVWILGGEMSVRPRRSA